MRAVCWEGKEKIQVETVPVPRPPVCLRSTSTTTLVNGGLTSGQGSAERQPGLFHALDPHSDGAHGSTPPRAGPKGNPHMKTELEKFYSLIDDIKVAMMTTRRPDGHLESRAMANQKYADGADLWFVTAEGSGKLRDIAQDPHINLAYYKSGSYEWVSASGVGRVSKDRAKIRELYEPDWKAWFGQEADPRHRRADDPRMVLIAIDVHAAVFLEVDKPKPVVLFELAKGWLTGARVEPGETHRLNEPHR